MKVLHICETATGGIATYFKLFDRAAPAGSRSVFLVPEEQAGEMSSDMVVRTHRGGRTVRGIIAMIAAMRSAIAEEKPDVMFFHSSFSLPALLALRVGLGGARHLPMFYCPHGWAISRLDSETSMPARMLRAVEGNLTALADRVVNISRHDAQVAERLGYRGRHVTIENAVSERREMAVASPFARRPGDIHLLFVGRFDRQKGIDLLAGAFARVRNKRPDLQLHLVGGEVLGDQPLETVAAIDRAGWIPADEIDAWYAAADALIVPSRWEGFGLVVPEAYRNATPVLVSDRGALPDLVEPGKTGSIFALEDLEEVLLSLDAATLAAMRPAARACYEQRFGEERWSRQFADLLGSVTGAVS